MTTYELHPSYALPEGEDTATKRTTKPKSADKLPEYSRLLRTTLTTALAGSVLATAFALSPHTFIAESPEAEAESTVRLHEAKSERVEALRGAQHKELEGQLNDALGAAKTAQDEAKSAEDKRKKAEEGKASAEREAEKLKEEAKAVKASAEAKAKDSSASPKKTAKTAKKPKVHSAKVVNAGGQGALDKCSGGLTRWTAYDNEFGGSPYLAQHNHCGGARYLSWKKGERVKIGGKTYVLSGHYDIPPAAVFLKDVKIPQGHAAYIQTCLTGNDEAMRTLLLDEV